MKEKIKKINIFTILLILLAVIGVGFGIYSYYKYSNKRTITVTGTSQGDYKNQISTYYLTLERRNKDKSKAVSDLNKNSEEIVSKIKDFGINDGDIKTQGFNVYEEQNEIYSGAPVGSDGWVASHTLEVIVRDTEKINEFTQLLSTMDIFNMWGPNLSVDETKIDVDELLISAIEDARNKAERMAKSMGGRVGKVVRIDEGMSQGGYMLLEKDGAMGGGSGVEIGTSTLSRTVVVTFELK